MTRGRSIRRVGGFVLVPMLSALAPLVVLPAITGSFGGDAWASVAVAQSVGSAGAVIVELGWGLNGPQRVARTGTTQRTRLYALSVVTKLVVLVPLSMPVALATASLAPSEPAAAQLTALGFLASGLSPVWYFIGEGRPARVLFLDAIPRLALSVGAALLIQYADAPLMTYAVAVILSGFLPPALTWFVTRSSLSYVRRFGPRRISKVLRSQGAALGGRAASALYIALPITLVGIAAPPALIVFSAAERMMRLFLSLLSSIPNSLQSWVGSYQPGESDRQHRVRVALALNTTLGLLAGAAFTILAPWGAQILFSGTADVGYDLAAVAGLVIFITCVSRATGGLGLVAYRRVPSIALSAAAGAVVGLPCILLLSSIAGARGAFLGEIIAECVVLTVQLIALARAGAFGRKGDR